MYRPVIYYYIFYLLEYLAGFLAYKQRDLGWNPGQAPPLASPLPERVENVPREDNNLEEQVTE